MLPLTPDNFNMGLWKQKKAGQIFHWRSVPLTIVEQIGGESKLGIPKHKNTLLSQLWLENELKTPLSLFMKPDGMWCKATD